MDEIEKLKKMAPIIEKLVKRGFFDKKEAEVLRLLGLLEVEEHAQQR